MILTFVNKGTSGPEGINYLFSEKDANGKLRNAPAELLEGDILLTKYLIEHNPREKKYSSYALSFRDNEKVTDEQLKEILQSLRDTFCTGLGPNRLNMLAVKHTDKNNIELHIIINDEVANKQFNPFPPGAGSKRLQQDFCAYWNHKLGFEQVVGNPFKACFSRFDAKVPSDRKKEYLKKIGNEEGVATKQRKEKLSAITANAVMSGKINNRNDLVKFLEQNDCKITRKGKDYLSIVLPGKEKAIRFKGGCFVEDADYRVLLAKHNTASKQLNTYQFKKVEDRLKQSMDFKRSLYARIYAPRKQRIPKSKWVKFTHPKSIKINKNTGVNIQQKKNISHLPNSNSVLPKLKNNQNLKSLGSSTATEQKQKNVEYSQTLGSSTATQTGGNSLEKLQISIGSLETKILGLSLKLSHVPVSQRSEIERRIEELKQQLLKLQQQLEDAKKSKLNKYLPENKNLRL